MHRKNILQKYLHRTIPITTLNTMEYFMNNIISFYCRNVWNFLTNKQTDLELLVITTLVLQGGFISYPVYKE